MHFFQRTHPICSVIAGVYDEVPKMMQTEQSYHVKFGSKNDRKSKIQPSLRNVNESFFKLVWRRQP